MICTEDQGTEAMDAGNNIKCGCCFVKCNFYLTAISKE